MCSPGNFELEFGHSYTEHREGCFLLKVTAMMIKGNESVKTSPDYVATETAHHPLEIVEGGTRFCVKRVGTHC